MIIRVSCMAAMVLAAVFVAGVLAGEGAVLPPQAVNLDFEAGVGESGYPLGWDGKHHEVLATGSPGYEVVLDRDVVHGGEASVRVAQVGRPGQPPQGMVIQAIAADRWRGRAIEVSAFMKTRDLAVDAGLLVCVLGDAGFLDYDTMEDGSVTGTTDWTQYRVAVQVGRSARMILFGAWVDGKGAIFVDDFALAEAKGDVPPVSPGAALVETPPTEAQVAWLRETAVEFATAEPGGGVDDLEPLREMIGDARIVGLGEGTHGTREFFQMKHRMVEFLAREMGFTVFSIEANTPEAYALNPYVTGEDGDPAALIAGMYFWTWNTREVLAMVEWMRQFNASGEGHIQFTGFDMQRPDVAMDIVTSFLERVDPVYAGKVSRDYQQIQEQKQAGGFGVATMSFPVEPARGKTVRYSGYIKTEDLTGGRAGLWWRVDAANQPAIAFDNMQTTGPKGTTEWTRYQIELPVSKDATNINFGVLMPGQGRAWFDELRVEIDGEPYSDSEKFDFDFEWDKIEGYYASQGGAYEARLDDEVFYSGSQSLCLESAVSAEEAQDAVDAVAVSKAVFDAMEASRERYTGETTIEETDWAIHNARIVNQSMRLKQQNLRAIRDEAMADNIAWILEHNPGAKIVLWAHNGHVGRDRGAMGGYLDEMFGDDYVPVGFIAGHGVYRAFDSDHRALAENPLADPPSGSIESYFEATGADRLIVDLRRSDAQSQVAAWPTETRMSRSIGAVAAQEQFYPVAVTEHYDILVYFRDTTASVPIRK